MQHLHESAFIMMIWTVESTVDPTVESAMTQQLNERL